MVDRHAHRVRRTLCFAQLLVTMSLEAEKIASVGALWVHVEMMRDTGEWEGCVSSNMQCFKKTIPSLALKTPQRKACIQ